jgi:glycosyltransferase involved in cell wall biosynthesis
VEERSIRILALAYACEPDKGSEPGAGWVWARLLAGLGETWVITRANNRDAIEARLLDVPERDRLRFLYVDLPEWARGWKRGPRGARFYYLLWQFVAVSRARRLRREVSFDLVWHLTLANVWLGSLAPFVGRPFVFGPVGGGVRSPWRLVPDLGFRGALYELARGIARGFAHHLNPLARMAWRRASLILAQNEETAAWFPRRHRSKAIVFPNAIVVDVPPVRKRSRMRPPTALFAGRLLPFKGIGLAIKALAQTSHWRLVVFGDGPDAKRLRRLATREGVMDRLEFRGWRPREEVLRAMRDEAELVLFPSLHDEAPLTVAEALAYGIAVMAFDRGGPRAIADLMGAERVPPEPLNWGPLVYALERVSGLSVVVFERADVMTLSAYRTKVLSLLISRRILAASAEDAVS